MEKKSIGEQLKDVEKPKDLIPEERERGAKLAEKVMGIIDITDEEKIEFVRLFRKLPLISIENSEERWEEQGWIFATLERNLPLLFQTEIGMTVYQRVNIIKNFGLSRANDIVTGKTNMEL